MRSIATDDNDHGSFRNRGFYIVRMRHRFLIHDGIASLSQGEVKLSIVGDQYNMTFI